MTCKVPLNLYLAELSEEISLLSRDMKRGKQNIYGQFLINVLGKH